MAWPSRRIPVPNPGATALLLFLLASLPHFPKVAAAGQIEIANASTSYRIELYANRSALWQITYSVPLLDSEDVALFAQYVQNFTASKQEFVDAFEQRMAQIVEQAADLTGREMYAVNFDSCAAIVNTPTVSRGTVTYRFLWVGFLEGAGSVLYMGDVFEGGLYLYGNDSITVIPPPGYRADYVSPKPDAFGGSITWHGPRNFPSGEPAAEFLSMETKLYVEFGNREAAEGEEVVVLGRIEPPLAVPVVITYTKPDGATFNQVVTATSAGSFATKVLVDEAGVWHVQATWSGNAEYLGSASQKAPLEVRRSSNFFWLVQYALPPAAALAAIVLFARRARRAKPAFRPPEDDEEKVLALLRSAGGRMLQKEISRQLGFSKSKTTGILNNLEAKNAIEKEKRGRNYIVKLK